MSLSSWIDQQVVDFLRTVGFMKVHHDYTPELCDGLELSVRGRVRKCDRCNWRVRFRSESPRVEAQTR